MSKVLGSWFWILGSAEPGTRTQHPALSTRNLLLLLVLFAAACGAQQAAPPSQKSKYEIPWSTLGTYSGHGNEQTPSFTSDSGVMRILWEAKPAGPPSPAPAFRVTIHSAISGRSLMVAVDQKGPGKGTAFVGEDPRVFFAEVDSNGLDWSFTVQERIN
ncbi:MAG: hypothetical protein ND807_14670 [Vicinamibacterales bacterium]|nr:hypothetical protein [Vicinamibacterales bacterium]